MFKTIYGIGYKVRALAFGLLLTASALVSAETGTEQQIIDIPITLMGNSPIVEAQLNDNPKAVHLLLDTGARDLVGVLTDQITQEYALRKLQESKEIHNTFTRQPIILRKLELTKFQLGSLVVNNLDSLYEDYIIWDFCDHKDCVHDGALGLAFFQQQHYNLFVDYKNSHVKLVPFGAASNAFRSAHSLSYVGMISKQQIGQIPVTVIWDTGASSGFVFNGSMLPSEYKKNIANTMIYNIPVIIGLLTINTNLIDDDGRFGAKSNCDGVCAYIGYNFFSEHTVFFDLENSKLYIN